MANLSLKDLADLMRPIANSDPVDEHDDKLYQKVTAKMFISLKIQKEYKIAFLEYSQKLIEIGAHRCKIHNVKKQITEIERLRGE